METSFELTLKKEEEYIMCSKTFWLQFVQGKSCWMWLEFYTSFGDLHVQLSSRGYDILLLY
jgi:hypothetical protein